MMKYAKYIALSIMIFLFASLGAFANEKDHGNMILTSSAQVGKTQLNPGHYKLQWTGTGNNVNIDIMQHGKTVATAQAKLVEHAVSSPYDDVVVRPMKNHKEAVEEVDFSNRKEALVLSPNSSMNR